MIPLYMLILNGALLLTAYTPAKNQMRKYNFELLCRKCGETITRRLSQFDELPRCNKCDNEMVVENVTTIENEVKENGSIQTENH